RMARPARVRMRRRKPCLRARRRLLGWKVRLLISRAPVVWSRRRSEDRPPTCAHVGHREVLAWAGESGRKSAWSTVREAGQEGQNHRRRNRVAAANPPSCPYHLDVRRTTRRRRKNPVVGHLRRG